MDNTQLKRIDNFTQALNILAGLNKENAELCIKVSSAVNELKYSINKMKSVLDEKKYFINNMKKLNEKLDSHINRLDYIENNFPDLSEPQSIYIDVPQQQNHPRNENYNHQVSVVSQIPVKNPTSVTSNSCVKKKSPVVPEVRHINVQELNSVQSYMRGRLTAESVNIFIDTLNSVLKKKYDILKQPRNRLRNFDSDLYDKWKTTERKASLDSGKYFCTAEDFTKLENFKLDKSAFNKLVILRHFQLIKEVRCGKETLYVLV